MLSGLEVFFGDANNAEARVYAQSGTEPLPANCKLTGRVVGPTCEYSRTLSAAIPLIARRAAAEEAGWLLAEAVMPDPCFWSQELPFLYRAEIELRRGDELLATEHRMFGIRPLGIRKGRLCWESRPWVLRAGDCRELPEQELTAWRAADLAMLVQDPGDDLCRQASELGTVLIAEVSERSERIEKELRRLARWPAVAMALLDRGESFDRGMRSAARNLILAARFSEVEPGAAPAWADLFVFEHGDADAIAAQSSAISLPVVAHRPAGWRDDLSETRRECDYLQRDLAGRGNFAGYIV